MLKWFQSFHEKFASQEIENIELKIKGLQIENDNLKSKEKVSQAFTLDGVESKQLICARILSF